MRVALRYVLCVGKRMGRTHNKNREFGREKYVLCEGFCFSWSEIFPTTWKEKDTLGVAVGIFEKFVVKIGKVTCRGFTGGQEFIFFGQNFLNSFPVKIPTSEHKTKLFEGETRDELVLGDPNGDVYVQDGAFR
jgi:hypothetical protein